MLHLNCVGAEVWGEGMAVEIMRCFFLPKSWTLALLSDPWVNHLPLASLPPGDCLTCSQQPAAEGEGWQEVKCTLSELQAFANLNLVLVPVFKARHSLILAISS